MTLVTILIPIYNHYKYLHKCFNSIFINQNKDVEIICIDDNSSDERVLHYLHKLNNEHSDIKILYNKKNQGISKVLNKGVEISDGEFIAFVDCDDYLASFSMKELLEKIKSNPKVDYFFSDRYEIDEDDKIIRRANYGGYVNIQPTGNIKSDLLRGMVASHLKVIRKSAIVNAGGFDIRLNGVQDWDLALKVAEFGIFYYINKPLYYHRIHSKSVTTSDSSSQLRKSNIVRRRYFDRWFEKKANSVEVVKIFKEIINNDYKITEKEIIQNNVCICTPNNYSGIEITGILKDGGMCIFDARTDCQIGCINFLREYNSYFDLIVTNNPRVIISLLGFVWNLNILHYLTN